MRTRSRYAVVALGMVAGLVLTGCGDESGAQGDPASPPPTLPTASSSTPGTPSGAGLPLTVRRTGGFAGFDDQVLIGTDGVATVSSRGKDPIRCKLDASLLTTLTAAARQVDWKGLVATKPTAKHPDDMILAVSANGGTARLEDPKVKAMVAPVTQLLAQATNPPGKLCTAI